MTASEARAALPHILDRVLAGEEVTITRYGQPVAVIVRPDSLIVRRAEVALAGAAMVRAAVGRSATEPLVVRPALSHERAEELVAEVRAGRSSR